MRFRNLSNILIITVLLSQASTFYGRSQARNVAIAIHVRGIYDSKISLLALSGSKTFKPIAEVQGIKNGETIKLSVSEEYLPGEFVLRFDYKETDASTPYPSEKNIFICKQDLELWVNPKFCNNSDSTWFQKDERENTAFAWFSVCTGNTLERQRNRPD